MIVKKLYKQESKAPRVYSESDASYTAEHRCEAARRTNYPKEYEAKHTKQCLRRASYEVDGIKMCAYHAGDAALYYLLEKSEEY